MDYRTSKGEKIFFDGDAAPDKSLLFIEKFVFRAEEVYALRETGRGRLSEAYSIKRSESPIDARSAEVITVELSPIENQRKLGTLRKMILNSQALSYNSPKPHRNRFSKTLD